MVMHKLGKFSEKNHEIVHLKYVNFTIYKICLNKGTLLFFACALHLSH